MVELKYDITPIIDRYHELRSNPITPKYDKSVGETQHYQVIKVDRMGNPTFLTNRMSKNGRLDDSVIQSLYKEFEPLVKCSLTPETPDFLDTKPNEVNIRVNSYGKGVVRNICGYPDASSITVSVRIGDYNFSIFNYQFPEIGYDINPYQPPEFQGPSFELLYWVLNLANSLNEEQYDILLSITLEQ